MFNKISLNIGLLFFIFILIIESVLFFLLYTTLADHQINQVMESLLTRGNTHRDVLEEHFDQSTLTHVGIMESASDFDVIITGVSGDVLSQSDDIDDEMKEVIQTVDYNNINAQGEVIEARWRERNYIASTSPIIINNELFGHVFMFVHTNQIKNTMSQLSQQFLFLGLITILLTIVTIFWLSKFISRPLIKMTKATEHLSEGTHVVKLNTKRKDELGDLARSITKLSNDLERLKSERNEFLASIAHELRTPLTYIKGYADILNRDGISEHEKKEYRAIVREETERLTLLIKHLFDLARMDQNKFTINRQEILINEWINKITEKLMPSFNEEGILLYVNCPDKIVLNIDPERMEQVLLNVLDNALKHTRKGNQVCLDVRVKVETIIIRVADQGEGIPHEDLPYVFDRLYRVEKSRSRRGGGTGLGLSIAKEIVEAHKGRIDIESQLGEGTTVCIEFDKGVSH